MVGKQIGPYEIVSKLGSGGMATVYRAIDTSLELSVALKLLHRGATVAGAARFREAVVEPDRHRDQIESSNSVYVLQRASVWE